MFVHMCVSVSIRVLQHSVVSQHRYARYKAQQVHNGLNGLDVN